MVGMEFAILLYKEIMDFFRKKEVKAGRKFIKFGNCWSEDFHSKARKK